MNEIDVSKKAYFSVEVTRLLKQDIKRKDNILSRLNFKIINPFYQL